MWVFGLHTVSSFWSAGHLVGIFSHPKISVFYSLMQKCTEVIPRTLMLEDLKLEVNFIYFEIFLKHIFEKKWYSVEVDYVLKT